MKVGFLITGRLKSTRLPKKLLLEICGRPVLSHMIDRIKTTKVIDEIVLCTSTNPQDDPLEELAKQEGISIFRGDEDDVLLRLYDAVVFYNLDYAINITADCPFVDPFYADKIVKTYKANGADLVRALDLPHGAFSYGIRPEALKKVIEIKNGKDTEVWGRYFTDTDLFNVYDLPITNPLHRRPDLRMTLDYPADFTFFKTIFDNLYEEGRVFSLDDILNLLHERPEIVAINKDCATSFQKRFSAQSEINLKSRYEVSTAVIIGCGSIGQRHIRNLRELGVTDILALRSRNGYYQDLPKELSVREFSDWKTLLDNKIDVAVISNPTSLHLDAVFRLLPYVKGIYIEKPLSHSLENVNHLQEEIKKQGNILFVGYNLVFHEAVQAVKKALNFDEIGAPLSFQAQVGHWLPDWHPYEDYNKTYYANKALGGGVTLTLIHEIHLAQELFGDVVSVNGLISSSDALPLDVDTIADLMMRHKSGTVSQLHLDFIQRPLHRSGLISCENGWVSYDLVNGKVFKQIKSDDYLHCIWDGKNYDPNQQYLDAMRSFVNYVREGRVRHRFDLRYAAHSLAIVEEAFASASLEAKKENVRWGTAAAFGQ